MILLLGLSETIDQLAPVDSVRCYGHVLRREDGHVLTSEVGHVLRSKVGHVLWREDGHVLRRENGHVLRREDCHVLMREDGHVLKRALEPEFDKKGRKMSKKRHEKSNLKKRA